MRVKSHEKVDRIIEKAININKDLNVSYRSCLFKTKEEVVKVDGFFLNMPLICFNSYVVSVFDPFCGFVPYNSVYVSMQNCLYFIIFS